MPVLIRLGAACYIGWGLLHLWVAAGMWRLALTQPPGMVQARLEQGALFMLFFALAGIAVAASWLWRGRRIGYWLNLLLISYADVIWIALFIVPGLVGGLRGWAGPVLWLAAAALTTAGYFGGTRAPRSGAR